MNKLNLSASLLEQVSKEGMSELFGGGLPFIAVNNGKICSNVNNGTNCDVINNDNKCSVINNKTVCSEVNNWSNCY